MVFPETISSLEHTFHYLLFFVAAVTPIIMYLSYRRFQTGLMKTIVGFFTLSFIFSALRWAGGSLARLHHPMTDSLIFNFLWLLSGILAAVFGLYAANLLFEYSHVCVPVKKSISKHKSSFSVWPK